MVIIRPTRINDLSESRLLSQCIGSQLISVNYFGLSGYESPWDSSHFQFDDFDFVFTAVELEFSNGVTTLVTWAMDGDAGGLAVLPSDPGLNGGRTAVTELGQWARFRGLTVQRVSAHIEDSTGSGGPTIDALHWEFRSSDAMFAVALGEDVDGQVRYMPDSLVVLHSEESILLYANDIPGKITVAVD